MKICLTCAAGGHLNQLMNIIDAFEGHDIFFITTKSETTMELGKIAKTYYTKDSPRPLRLGNLEFLRLTFTFYTLFISWPCFTILIREKPDVIVSTGGSPTICLCCLSKLMGTKIVYIESLARIDDLSVTGKYVYKIADLFLVQWESLLEKYHKAKYWGRVL
jgi:UDP-N-acetylglucosamine:LPS N-acetylglucosamine transferase